jgi:hypothetical protein
MAWVVEDVALIDGISIPATGLPDHQEISLATIGSLDRDIRN